MAIVKMSQIKTTLHRSIAYIINPDKTQGGALVSANYAEDVSDPVRLANAMLESIDGTSGGRRTGGVLAHHVIHSFSHEDSRTLTARQVHDMGVAFANEITKGEYQYVIATHVDRDHTHNHIIICAANTVTHRKMRVQRDTLGSWRTISDELCRQHGLNILPARQRREKHQAVGSSDRASVPVRRGSSTARYGASLAELYASAKGDAIKDRIRHAIDMAASSCRDFDAFRRELHRSGVTLTVRGRHLTFTDVASGLKVRDVKLGRAYDEANIMARIGRRTVTPISFNRRMIVGRSDHALRVWLPGTKRKLSISIPLTQIVRNGDTYRAYLPTDTQQVIVDRHGRFARWMASEGLYEYFSRPPVRLETAAREHLPITPGKSEAQRRWYLMQAQRLDRLRDLADELNMASQLAKDDVSVAEAIDKVRSRIESEREAFQSMLVALDEERQTERDDEGDGTAADDMDVSAAERDPMMDERAPSAQQMAELKEHERNLDRLARELDTLMRLEEHTRQTGQPRRVRQPE